MSVLIFLLLTIIINAQNITEIIEPKCDGETIKYSIIANLSEYLENENNIDGREFYNSIDALKSKKIGTLSGYYFNRSMFDNITDYNSYDDLIDDLRNHKLDAIVLNDGIGNNTQMFTNDISALSGRPTLLDIGIGLQKDNVTLLNQVNEFINKGLTEQKKHDWLGINYQIQYINKTLSGENGTINVVVLLNNPPYSYKDKSGEMTGGEINFIYDFARDYGYQINLITANSQDEEIEFLKNKSADIAAGYFIIRNDKRDEINFSNVWHKGAVATLVKYENLPESAQLGPFYENAKEFDGEDLGILKDSSLEDLTKSNFPNSKYTYYDGTYQIFQALLMEEIEGFLMDEPNAEYFKIVYPERITYFPEDFQENQYAFGFQKTDEGTILLDKFNQFLSNTNLKEIYDKWNVDDTTKLTIDKSLNTSAETINAAFLMDLNPLCFLEGTEVKGYEVELLYKFAKENNYNINFMEVDVGDRVSYIEENKANITGGWFTITDERKKSVNFSNPIHNAGTVLVTRVDRKKDTLTLKVIDNNYNEKTNNEANVQVKFSDKIKNSSCVFPDKYNDTIIINCTISDLDNIDPYEEGFEFVNTSDKIQLICSDLELNNFFQANSKISGHENIITESDKSNKVCTSNSNSTNQDNNKINPVVRKQKSSGGLSTGAIIGIIIPCVVVLIAAIATAAAYYNKKKVPPSVFNSETVKNFDIKKEQI